MSVTALDLDQDVKEVLARGGALSSAPLRGSVGIAERSEGGISPQMRIRLFDSMDPSQRGLH